MTLPAEHVVVFSGAHAAEHRAGPRVELNHLHRTYGGGLLEIRLLQIAYAQLVSLGCESGPDFIRERLRHQNRVAWLVRVHGRPETGSSDRGLFERLLDV